MCSRIGKMQYMCYPPVRVTEGWLPRPGWKTCWGLAHFCKNHWHFCANRILFFIYLSAVHWPIKQLAQIYSLPLNLQNLGCLVLMKNTEFQKQKSQEWPLPCVWHCANNNGNFEALKINCLHVQAFQSFPLAAPCSVLIVDIGVYGSLGKAQDLKLVDFNHLKARFWFWNTLIHVII